MSVEVPVISHPTPGFVTPAPRSAAAKVARADRHRRADPQTGELRRLICHRSEQFRSCAKRRQFIRIQLQNAQQSSGSNPSSGRQTCSCRRLRRSRSCVHR